MGKCNLSASDVNLLIASALEQYDDVHVTSVSAEAGTSGFSLVLSDGSVVPVPLQAGAGVTIDGLTIGLTAAVSDPASIIGPPVVAVTPAPTTAYTGLCGNPQTVPVTAAGAYLLDTSSTPDDLFISDATGTNWVLVPNTTLTHGDSFECTNLGTTLYWHADIGGWFDTQPTFAPDPNDPSTWPAPTAPAVLYMVYNVAGQLIGVVDQTGPHPVAMPTALEIITEAANTPALMQLLAQAIISLDAGNSLRLGSDSLLFENDGV